MTGYYEPERSLTARAKRSFTHPIYGVLDSLWVIDLAELYP